MLLSKVEMVGWAIGILIVATMGIIVFAGPFHHINKVQAFSGPPQHVKIINNPVTIGQFVPGLITVHVNQPITFTNDSTNEHTVTDQAKETFDSGYIAVGASFTYIPSKAGTFHYICSIHPNMLGILTVVK